MSTSNERKFNDYYLNYKIAYTIPAVFQSQNSEHTITVEIRKGAKLGCELFTVIDGILYRFSSKLYRGALQKLILGLPDHCIVTIPHLVYLETEGKTHSLIINEEIYTARNDQDDVFFEKQNRPVITLHCKVDAEEIATNRYEFDEIYEALDELRRKLRNKFEIIRICSFCRFIDHFANTAICLRDLTPVDFSAVQEMGKKRELKESYYEKVAWDIEEFHYCAAFEE